MISNRCSESPIMAIYTLSAHQESSFWDAFHPKCHSYCCLRRKQMMNRKRKRRQLRSCDLFFFRRHPSAISPGPVSRLKYGDGMFQVVLQCNCYILARTKQWKSIASQEISESESRILVHRSALDDLSILVFKDFHPTSNSATLI